MIASNNCEWISLMKCISAARKALSSWIIFKDKVHKTFWMKALHSNHIALSDNGWTDNELELAWLKDCFEPEICQYHENNEQWTQILIFDEHVSHISTKAIHFCVKMNIVTLCLSQHSTHLLQSLDVEVFALYAHFYKKDLSE